MFVFNIIYDMCKLNTINYVQWHKLLSSIKKNSIKKLTFIFKIII